MQTGVWRRELLLFLIAMLFINQAIGLLTCFFLTYLLSHLSSISRRNGLDQSEGQGSGDYTAVQFDVSYVRQNLMNPSHEQ